MNATKKNKKNKTDYKSIPKGYNQEVAGSIVRPVLSYRSIAPTRSQVLGGGGESNRPKKPKKQGVAKRQKMEVQTWSSQKWNVEKNKKSNSQVRLISGRTRVAVDDPKSATFSLGRGMKAKSFQNVSAKEHCVL